MSDSKTSEPVAAAMDEIRKNGNDKNKVTIVVFSGELDKVLAAFNIATGAASMGMDATLFFTFWGLNVLKKNDAKNTATGLMKRMLGRLNRGGSQRLPLSKFHMAGLGTWMMKKLMRQHKMPNIDEMIALCKELGVQFMACTITMGIMGIEKEALRPEIDKFVGVVTYLAEAKESSVNLFI